MSWLPSDFFIGHPGPPELRPNRPIGQGDVFANVPVAIRTRIHDGRAEAAAKIETVIVMSSSCGMRKKAGRLNDLVHVAPISRLESLAPGWSDPWEGHLRILPLPRLTTGDPPEPAAANLERIGLCSTDTLEMDRRVACVSLEGMRALKQRVSTYFSRAEDLPEALYRVGAHEDWHELDLWERWTERTGSDDGFQQWLAEANPNFPLRRRRDTIYDDLVGIRQQLDQATSRE